MKIEMDSKKIAERDIKGALERHKSLILQNLENMTLKALRKDLERDLGLKVDELKPYKQDIALYVDQMLAGTNFEDKKGSGTKAVKAEQFTSRFLKLRKICTKATIKLPPSIYRMDSKAMEEAVLKYLNERGLQEGSSHTDIILVKEKIGLERDLDGIDACNIIDSGPRTRRKTTAKFMEKADGENGQDETLSAERQESDETESQSDFSPTDHAIAEDSY